jgi:hypothetical protein
MELLTAARGALGISRSERCEIPGEAGAELVGLGAQLANAADINQTKVQTCGVWIFLSLEG